MYKGPRQPQGKVVPVHTYTPPMKMYGEVEVSILPCTFLTSALNRVGGEWLESSLGCLIPGEIPPVPTGQETKYTIEQPQTRDIGLY
jgi:hypothetical protein